jgi:hypothetical protein
MGSCANEASGTTKDHGVSIAAAFRLPLIPCSLKQRLPLSGIGLPVIARAFARSSGHAHRRTARL